MSDGNYICLARKYRPQNFGARAIPYTPEFRERMAQVMRRAGDPPITSEEAYAHVCGEFGIEESVS